MDVWQILFLIAAGQGIFLAALLFFGQGKWQYANRILSLFILLFSLNTLENVAYWTQYQLQVPHLAGTTRGFVFLFGPLLWWYVNSVSHHGWRVRFSDMVHLIPFVLYTIIRIPFYALDAEAKRQVLMADTYANPGLALFIQVGLCTHLLLYSILLLRAARNSELRLSDVASRLAISTHHVSQVINEYFGKSFHELMTEYRMKEAVRLLDDPANEEKLLAIALNAGFNNKTSFHTAFRKYMGCSPKEYKERRKEKVATGGA